MTTRILVLSGMGDIYWVAVALQSFCERNRIEDPEVWIWSFDERPRSLGYVQRIPFVRAGGYWTHHSNVPGFRESYLDAGRSVFRNYQGFDWYLSANGTLRVGRPITDAFRGCALDWFFPLTPDPVEDAAIPSFQAQFGPYVVAFISDMGMFERWLKAWPPDQVAAMYRTVSEQTGRTVVFTGCAWDKEITETISGQVPGSVNLCGQTSLSELFGLFRGADGTLGFCGGNTIKSVYFGVPTMMLWSTYFRAPGFYQHACPNVPWYRYAVVENRKALDVAAEFGGMLRSATPRSLSEEGVR